MSSPKPPYQIGDTFTFDALPDSSCTRCGYQFPCRTLVIYAGVYSIGGNLKEVFALVEPITCPECQSRIEAMLLPLGTTLRL